MARGVEAFYFDVIFAMGDDGAGEVEEAGKVLSKMHIFQGARIIFGGEEIIAVFKQDAFADVFEGIGVGPADADGFLGQDDGLFARGGEFPGLRPSQFFRGKE